MRAFKPQQIAVFAAGFAVLLILLHLVGVLSWVSGMVATATYRLAAPLHRIGSGMASAGERDECACAADIKAQLEQLMIDNSKLRTLAAENAALKTALDFQERDTDALVMARVVAESSDITNRGLVIDRGSGDGIEPGQPVVVDDGLLVGKIHTTGKKSSTVLMLTDSVSRLAVSLQGGSGTTGLLEGDRGLSMMMSLIPQNEIVNVGDVVVTSGLEPGVRRGLIVGVVETVHKDDQEPFQTATVAPFNRAEYPVFVQVLVSDERDNEE